MALMLTWPPAPDSTFELEILPPPDRVKDSTSRSRTPASPAARAVDWITPPSAILSSGVLTVILPPAPPPWVLACRPLTWVALTPEILMEAYESTSMLPPFPAVRVSADINPPSFKVNASEITRISPAFPFPEAEPSMAPSLAMVITGAANPMLPPMPLTRVEAVISPSSILIRPVSARIVEPRPSPSVIPEISPLFLTVTLSPTMISIIPPS